VVKPKQACRSVTTGLGAPVIEFDLSELYQLYVHQLTDGTKADDIGQHDPLEPITWMMWCRHHIIHVNPNAPIMKGEGKCILEW